MANYIYIDWQQCLVNEWFNASDKGSFVYEVTANDLYNNLTDLDVIVVHEGPQYRKPPISTHVKAWFKHRLNQISSGYSGDTVFYVVRGCTPEQNLMLTEGAKKLVERLHPSPDELIRLGQRFSSRFVLDSGTIIANEAFFNQYIDEIYEYCEERMPSAKYHFYTSEYLPTINLRQIAYNFFSAKEGILYTPPHLKSQEKAVYSILAQDSNGFFTDKINENQIECEDDSSASQILDFGTNDFLEYIKRTM